MTINNRSFVPKRLICNRITHRFTSILTLSITFLITFECLTFYISVALLSDHVNGGGTAGSTIQFNNVHHSYGITNSTLSKFKSTGTFVCEVEGLYLIATTILSSITDSWFKLMKNQEELSRTYIAYYGSGGGWYSGTGLAIVTLQVKDTIYIEVGRHIGIYNPYNTLIITKIK